MKLNVIKGQTSKLVQVFIQDSSSTTGAGLTGLAHNTGSLSAYYYREGAASATAITLATMTLGTWASGGFIVVDGTNLPGLYQLGIPDAALASGANSVVIMLKGAANMAPVVLEVQLVSFDPNDAVRMGLTALPNAAAEAAGGLYTRGTGAGQINQTNNGQIDANAARTGGTTNTGRDIGASVLLSSGTGTGQLDFTSGVVKANLAQILATALTETTGGFIAAAFKKFFDKASPTGTINSLPDAVAGASGGVFIAGTNAATTVTTALTTTFTGNLTGSVGSVVGAVGSVTGSVGSIASGGIASTSFAAGAIDAAAIAANAIGASELAADAVAEIQSGLATSTAQTTAQTSLDTIAGYIDTEVASILSAVDTEIAAIKAKTDNLPSSPAAVGSAMTLTSGERDAIADAGLKRDWTAISGEPAEFSTWNALRFARGLWNVVAGVLHVFKEDGVTDAWTANLTTDNTADPITGSDTVGS